MPYAENTTISISKSKEDIENLLMRYGASGFGYQSNVSECRIEFAYSNRYIRFTLNLPNRNDRQFHYTDTRGSRRKPEIAEKLWEQASRQKWRALLLVIKAKLESIEAGISSFEDEFLAYTVMPNNRTLGEQIEPILDQAYELGQMPNLLTIGSGQ